MDRDKRLKYAARFGILPALFYLLCFAIFTFPLITTFSTHFWGDSVDASQSAWNLWWMKKALLDLHQSPWQTTLMYYPAGISLLPHDLNAANALIGVVLQSVFSIQQTYNLIVIAGFVLSGLTMYWLAYYLTASHPASLISGFMFTFSSYHFAHLISGHLTVLALQGIPLFVLCWLWFLKQPSFRRAIITAVVLAYVAYTSLYFFLYGVMIGTAILY
jgi:hypothetical protein